MKSKINGLVFLHALTMVQMGSNEEIIEQVLRF